MGWVFLAVAQVLLGISILWTGRIPEVATLHVLIGAGLTLTGWLLGLASWRTAHVLPLVSKQRGESKRRLHGREVR